MRRLWSVPGAALAVSWLILLGPGWAHGAQPQASNGGPGAGSESRSRPLGFLLTHAGRELEAEAKAVAVPTPENARNWLRTLTAEPHVAGTPADYKTAVFVRDKLREWGWKADLEELEVLLNYPAASPTLSIRRPVKKDIALDEAPVATDKDSASSAAFGAFNGYGTSGAAAGQIVYANYGRPEDYAALEKTGVDVKDKLVLVRYGEIFRGLKVRNAQKRGVKGLLIYSDPAEDGYAKGDIYPLGPFRPGSAIQRGSVQFLSLGPGDPSTPFGPSTKDAKRIPFSPDAGFPIGEFPGSDSGHHLPEVMGDRDWLEPCGLLRDHSILALSYDAAHEILKLLAGPTVPSGWQGGLPLAYHLGPGPAEAEMWDHHGLPGPQDLECDRDDPRHGRAGSLDHDWQSPRCMGLWCRRPRKRNGCDPGDVPRWGPR